MVKVQITFKAKWTNIQWYMNAQGHSFHQCTAYFHWILHDQMKCPLLVAMDKPWGICGQTALKATQMTLHIPTPLICRSVPIKHPQSSKSCPLVSQANQVWNKSCVCCPYKQVYMLWVKRNHILISTCCGMAYIYIQNDLCLYWCINFSTKRKLIKLSVATMVWYMVLNPQTVQCCAM